MSSAPKGNEPDETGPTSNDLKDSYIAHDEEEADDEDIGDYDPADEDYQPVEIEEPSDEAFEAFEAEELAAQTYLQAERDAVHMSLLMFGPEGAENTADEFRTLDDSVLLALQRSRARSDEGELPVTSNFESIGVTSTDAAAALRYKLLPNLEHIEEDSPSSGYVLLIENDVDVAREYGSELVLAGCKVLLSFSVEEALENLSRYGASIWLVVIDIRMPNGDYFGDFETVAGRKSGVFLSREILASTHVGKIIALSNSIDPLDIEFFESRENCYFCAKEDYTPSAFARFVRSTVMKDLSCVKSFIIHGHDRATALDLQHYLQNKLGLPEPIILAEQPSHNRTTIDKLERHLLDADYIFALFTADDLVAEPIQARRARQNVVFEFGYVSGLFRRTSGRVIFLCKEDVELPSDLDGMIYIDISNGIEAADKEIRRELRALLT